MRKGFIQNKSALAYVWAMGALAIGLNVAVYFPLSYAFEHVYALIVGSYQFTGDTALGLAAISFICSSLLAIGLIFTINWAFVNAKASQYD